MRAQLRTYHSIPALQAHQDPNAYKQLQDAPRLKSILKGATEDEPQPNTIEEIKGAKIPRTNPVNLIFVISQYAPKISDVHFPVPRDFFDLIIRATLTSKSRARAFLWLMWWYLESDFGYEDSQRNPFGEGVYAEGDQDSGILPLKVPTMESINEAQAALENVDTEDEIHYGEVKRKERIAILASEPSPAMTALKRARKEKGLTAGGHGMHSEDEVSEVGWARGHAVGRGRALETGSEYTRSPSPRNYAKHGGDMRINNLLNNDDGMSEASPPHAAAMIKKGPGRGNWRRNKLKDTSVPQSIRPQDERSHHVPLLPNTGQLNFVNEAPQALQPSPSGYHSTLLSSSMGSYKPTMSYQSAKRGMTQHQSAVMNHRAQQISYTLDRRIRRVHAQARRDRQLEGPMLRAWKRIRIMPAEYDSEEEKIKVRKAKERADKDDDWRSGKAKENDYYADLEPWQRPRVYMAGLAHVVNESSDIGEEAKSIARSFDRCKRRMKRWEDALPGDAMIKRRQLQARGLLHGSRRRRALVTEPSMENDGVESIGNAYGSRQRGRSGTGRRSENMDVEPDDEDGAAELDEEDRELLGEVDAGESEEDEDMDDD
jgi:Ino eighty subunit 1